MWPAHKRVHVRREDCANVQISGMDLTGRVCEPRSVRHRRLIRHESPGRAACSSLVVARRARARTSRADEQALPGAKAPTKFRATERGLRSTSKRVVLGAAPQGHSRRVWRVIPSGSVGTDTPKSETAETARLPYHGAVIGGATLWCNGEHLALRNHDHLTGAKFQPRRIVVWTVVCTLITVQ
jgi:hypothetical protein